MGQSKFHRAERNTVALLPGSAGCLFRAPLAIPHSPSIPARLALSNQNGLIVYSGTVGDDATRTAISNSLKTVFGAHKITGDLAVDLHAGAAGWTKDLKATLDKIQDPRVAGAI